MAITPTPQQPYNHESGKTAPPRADALPITALYKARKEHALNHYQTFFAKIARRYDLYRGFYRGQFSQFRNNIHIPFLFAVIQSDVARKVQTSFGSWPIVDFSGTDQAISRKNSTLISAQMKDCNSFIKGVDFFLDADMYGTAFARDGWKTVRRFERWREMGEPDPIGGQVREVIREEHVTRFDGPNWENVDILDCWPQPGRKTIEECQWVLLRYYLDIDEIEQLAQLGVYDRAAVNQLKQGSMPRITQDSYLARYNVYRSQQDFDSRASEKFARPVELVDMIGYVPDEFALDGVKFTLVTVANDGVVLRNRPFPFWHGEIPLHAYSPMRDPHYIHGVGKIEVAEKLQYMANRFANQKADALDLYMDPPIFVNTMAGLDEQNLYMRAGRIIHIDGTVGEDQIRPMVYDYRGIQTAMEEIQQIWKNIQLGTGSIEDVTMGMSSSDRQTAREFQGRQEHALTRHMLEAREAEEGFIEKLANRFRMSNRQFLKVPHEVKIIGSEALVNPITGLPLPVEPTIIDLADINADYSARAVGASQMLGKGIRQQNLVMLLQTLQANPVAMQVINWVNFLRYTFKTFDIPNADEFMVSQQIPAVNQLANESCMSPEQTVGAAGDASQSPEALMALLGGQMGGM